MGQTFSNLGNANVTNPQQANWGDLDASEKSARLFAGAGKGALQGFQNMQQGPQQGGGVSFQVPTPSQPQVDLSAAVRGNTAADGPGTGQRNARNPYFYGYGQ